MAVKMALRSRWPLVRSASLLFRSIELTQRVTIPEIMLTAVEIAPRMIRIEMIGVRIFAPTPFCTRTSIGTEALASSAT